MGAAFLHGNGGGSAGLSFKIIGGTTEPSNPSENMIWVNTANKITSYIFDFTEPESPSECMVWISIGTSSPAGFNALKKNSIMVYPMYAKQYISGAWVDVTAKNYLNGVWTSWFFVLKDLNTKRWVATETASRATVSDSENGLVIKFTGGAWSYVGGYVNEGVDLTSYKTVVFSGTNTGKAETVELCIYDANKTVIHSVALPEGSNSTSVTNKLEDYPIPCETVKGVCYLGIRAHCGAYVGSITLESITIK